MNYVEMIKTMSTDMRERLNLAVQMGRWPDGRALTPEQKEAIVEALIAYQAIHEADRDEPFTVNENGELRAMKRIKEKSAHTHDDEQPKESPDEFTLTLK